MNRSPEVEERPIRQLAGNKEQENRARVINRKKSPSRNRGTVATASISTNDRAANSDYESVHQEKRGPAIFGATRPAPSGTLVRGMPGNKRQKVAATGLTTSGIVYGGRKLSRIYACSLDRDFSVRVQVNLTPTSWSAKRKLTGHGFLPKSTFELLRIDRRAACKIAHPPIISAQSFFRTGI